MKHILYILSLLLFAYNYSAICHAEAFESPGMGNPIVPGYFADPTVRKFGDTYYMYATTDGTAAGNGPSQVWISKDFVNWTNLSMNWPNTKWIWAPDVVKANDNRYYFYYSQPCEIYAGVSDTPIGPWQPLIPNTNGMIVPNKYVPPVITLDWQTFLDDDGRRFAFFCTWAIYKGHGCGYVQVGDDMLPIDSTKGMIPNGELPDLFEGPFMIKKDGIFYLMYSAGSCHDDTYRLHYATSDKITGPYHYDKATNPLLSTNSDGSIHGPGHHCILQDGDNYYIIYHRHDNPHSNHGMHRQIAADKLIFGPNNTIQKIVPTHKGIGYLAENTNPFANLVYTKNITASTYYDDRFLPKYAVDDNNGTLWKAKDNSLPQTLQIDLGETQTVKRTWTEFQYPNWYYQYLIEYSIDGTIWHIFSDKRDNTLAGSPMVDFGDIQCRYLKLTITGLEKPGMYAGLWNFKAFSDAKQDPPQTLVHLEADDLPTGQFSQWQNNKGMLGGSYNLTAGKGEVRIIDGRKAVVLSDQGEALFNGIVPENLKNNNAYTELIRVYLPDRQSGQKKWQFFAFVRDGQSSTFYFNGETRGKRPISQNRPPMSFRLGNFRRNNADNEIAYNSVQIIARALEPAEIKYIMDSQYTQPAPPSPHPQGLLVDLNAESLKPGTVSSWTNLGITGGEFLSSESSSCNSNIVAGVKAVSFNGSSSMASSFPAPLTLKGNSNFTIATWVFNPDISETEFIVSFSEDGGLEGTCARMGFGSSREFGAMVHGGWADLSYRNPPQAGKWQHIAVTFDGSIEKIYVNGQLDNQEEKMLHLAGAENILLGRSYGQPEYFSGSIASLKLFDKALTPTEIKDLANTKPKCAVSISINTAFHEYGPLKEYTNEGSLQGRFTSNNAPAIGDINGKIALIFDQNNQLILDNENISQDRFSIEALLCPQSDQQLFFWKDKNNTIQPAFKMPALKTNTWQHIIASDSGIYINGQKVADTPTDLYNKTGSKFLIGNGFKGALAQLTIHTSTVTDNIAQSLYATTAKDILPPTVCSFKIAPEAISPNTIVMAATPSSDASGSVRYYFQEITKNPGSLSSGWVKDTEYVNLNLQPDSTYKYALKVSDRFGNITQPTETITVSTDKDLFNIYYDDFTGDHDYLAQNTDGTIWDGLVTTGEGNMKANSIKNNSGNLHIESYGAIVDQQNGAPIIYKTITGNFTAETKVSNMQGWSERKMPGLLEPALIARVADKDLAGPGEDHIRSGIFPYWNCGNLWTSMNGQSRPQGFNSTGYRPDMYLQIQRQGDLFYLRTSPDGKNWTQIKGSPVYRPDMNNLPLQVGLTQTINENNLSGWVEYEWFRVITKK